MRHRVIVLLMLPLTACNNHDRGRFPPWLSQQTVNGITYTLGVCENVHGPGVAACRADGMCRCLDSGGVWDGKD